MDTTLLPKDRLLLEAALDAVRAMGFKAQLVQEKPALGRTHADALVRLTNGDQEILYAIELKRAVKPATLGALLHQIERLGKQAGGNRLCNAPGCGRAEGARRSIYRHGRQCIPEQPGFVRMG